MRRVATTAAVAAIGVLVIIVLVTTVVLGGIGSAFLAQSNQQAAGALAMKKQRESAAARVGDYCAQQLGDSVIVTTASQREAVRTVVGIGKTMNVPVQGQIVATMVAKQESDLMNPANSGRNIRGFQGFPAPGAAFWLDLAKRSLNYPHTGVGNDADSIGMFQQRPSTGWVDVPGVVTARQNPDLAVQLLLNPKFATQMFYGGPGGVANRGLLDIQWQGLAPTVAAQKVQGSAFPFAYARHEAMARQLVTENQDAPALPLVVQGSAVSAGAAPGAAGGSSSPQLGCPAVPGGAAAGTPGAPGAPKVPAGPASGLAAKIIKAGEPALGTMYLWGGTGPRYDCSGLTQMMFRDGAGITLPRVANDQWKATANRTIPNLAAAKPGDLLFWGGGVKHHVAIYVGNGKMMEAPSSGKLVRITDVREKGMTAITRVLPDA